MRSFKFRIGDLLKVNPAARGTEAIGSPANPDKQYKEGLRVIFQFWDGRDNIYIVRAEDGIEMFLMEIDAELVEAAPSAPVEEPTKSIPKDLLQDLTKLGILDSDVRSHNVGNSDYSKHVLQPWSIWLDWNLNPWDADIVKRVLRTKKGDARMLDYDKIIHICKERIRQLKLGME